MEKLNISLEFVTSLLKPIISSKINELETRTPGEGFENRIKIDEDAKEIFEIIPKLEFTEEEMMELARIENKYWRSRKLDYENYINYHFDDDHKLSDCELLKITTDEQIFNLDYKKNNPMGVALCKETIEKNKKEGIEELKKALPWYRIVYNKTINKK
jgi:hypothetical protein